MSSFNWSSVSSTLTALANAGVSITPSIVSIVGSNAKLKTNTTSLLTQAAAVIADPAALQNIISQLLAQPGFPTDAVTVGMVESLKQPGIPPVLFSQTIAQIEAKVNSL
jgi:hypothetical protein